MIRVIEDVKVTVEKGIITYCLPSHYTGDKLNEFLKRNDKELIKLKEIKKKQQKELNNE